MLIRLVCSLLLFMCSSIVWGAQIYSVALKSLTTDTQVQLKEYKDKLLIVTIFEPECAWCMKQFKALQKLQHQCEASIASVGVGIGNKEGLKELVRRTKVSFATAEASPSFIALVGEPKGTPFTILFDEKGELITTLLGYIPHKKLRYAFQDICPMENTEQRATL